MSAEVFVWARGHAEFENLRAEIEGGKRKTAVAPISGIRSDAFRSGLATLAFRCDNNCWLPPEVRTSRRRVAQKRRRRCRGRARLGTCVRAN